MKKPDGTSKNTDHKILFNINGNLKTHNPSMKLVHRENEERRDPWRKYFPVSQHINPHYRLFAQNMLCILAKLRELPDDRVFCFDTSHQDLFLTTPGRWHSQRCVGICMNRHRITITYRSGTPNAMRAQNWVNIDAQSITEAVSYFLLAIEKSGAATKCLAPGSATGPT